MPPTAEPTARANKNGSASSPSIADPGPDISQRFHSHELLPALQAMRVGDFSVRISGDWIGIEGKIADTFNEIAAANQRMAQQLERVGGARRQGRQDQAARPLRALQRRLGRNWNSSVNTLIDDLLWPTNEVTRAIGAGWRKAIFWRRSVSTSTGGRCRANSCAPPPSSTP